ncbi:MAG: class I SAM-dependent methyltransferase [Bryobacteraceae bacterium]
MPILHSRDAAYGKVASIGRVNPRAGGPVNTAIQAVKRLISRALDWHVRDQVEFNRAILGSVEAILAALEENNRSLRDLSNQIAGVCSLAEANRGEADEARRDVDDALSHWRAWRSEWERKLSVNETQFLRGLADLQTAFQHRATLMESNFRDLVGSQHRDFEGALERSGSDVQKRLWADLEKIRFEYLNLIQQELRVIRQRPAVFGAPEAPSAQPVGLDYWLFSEKFRGPEGYVRKNQSFYVDRFRGRKNVVDIGCGRGEFLDLARDAGIGVRGIDLNPEFLARCREKGHAVEQADLFSWLEAQPDRSLGGIFCSQVVEHLPPPRLPEFIRLAAAKLDHGAPIAIETPNPECLAIFATHFYLDPTHTRPIPAALLQFYLQEAGFIGFEVHYLTPAIESMPELASIAPEFRNKFFGALDYAVIATAI